MLSLYKKVIGSQVDACVRRGKNINISSAKAIFIFTIIFLILSIFSYFDYNEINKYGRYTVCYIEKRMLTTKRGYVIRYYYFVNGKRYVGTDDVDKKTIKSSQKRYYLKFSSKNPNKKRGLFDQPVPDSLQYIPKNGWNKIP